MTAFIEYYRWAYVGVSMHVYGCCKPMSTQRESICCHDIEETKSLIDDSHIEMLPSYITQHADFSNVCLCRAVLTETLYGHRHQYGSADVPADENR